MSTKRLQKYHYIPNPDGHLVRKYRDELTAREQEFVRATKDLKGRNADEIAAYKEAAKKIYE